MTTRVLVTRPGPLVDALQKAGFEVTLLPTVQIEALADRAPLDAALARLDFYNWLVLTSPKGVRLGLGPVHPFTGRIAAIGPATASTLQELGWPSPWLPTRPNTRTLAAELPIQPGDRVLLLRSNLADAVLPNALAARGARVDDVVAYRTVPRAEPLAGLPDADAIVLMSPSAVDGLLNALDGDATRLGRTCIVVPGPTTAAHARARGLMSIEAAEPTPEAIVATVTALAEPAGAAR
jgi:uroporphyrinogen-III synthase